jgi:hypothetical protein
LRANFTCAGASARSVQRPRIAIFVSRYQRCLLALQLYEIGD